MQWYVEGFIGELIVPFRLTFRAELIASVIFNSLFSLFLVFLLVFVFEEILRGSSFLFW